jgi:class 3 adenylate cyclase
MKLYRKDNDYKHDHYVQALSTFVPEHIKRFISDNAHDTFFTPPLIQEMHSVVLFADIGGFSLLGERMAAKGKPGCEELGFYLNRYFEQLVKFTFRSGGDVVKFVGDALIVAWPSDWKISPKVCVHRAIQCSLEIAETMAGAQLADDVKLSVKIGIGVGKSTVLHIGDAQKRLEHMLVGQPLKQALLCQDEAEVGNVIISKEAYDLVSDLLDDAIEIKNKKMYKVENLNSSVKNMKFKTTNWRRLVDFSERLSFYIPPSVLPHLHMNLKGWAAELRWVTVLFVNLDLNIGLKDNISDKIHVLAQCVLKTILASLYRYEGSLNKFLLDDKGTTVIACFGLPPMGHGEDPTRGILASLQMHKQLSKTQTRCSIGVTTGLVYCGLLGSGVFREYTVLGDTVNLASRIMIAAKKYFTHTGGIFCCAQTRNLAYNEKTILFEALPSVSVRGKCCPVKVFCPTRIPLTDRKERVLKYKFVSGKSNELQEIRESLHDSKAGVILVMGGVGTGKTHLLQYLMSNQDQNVSRSLDYLNLEKSVKVIYGNSMRFTQKDKYAIWKQILIKILMHRGLFTEESWRKSVYNGKTNDIFLAIVKKKRPDLIPFLMVMNDLLGTDFKETPELHSLTGNEPLWKAFEILLFLIETSTEIAKDSGRNVSPILIIFDDVHDMEKEDWHITACFCRAVRCGILPNTKLILATRPLHMLKYTQHGKAYSGAQYIDILSWKKLKPPARIIFKEVDSNLNEANDELSKEEFTKGIIINFLKCERRMRTANRNDIDLSNREKNIEIGAGLLKFVHKKTAGCPMFVLKYVQCLLLQGKIIYDDNCQFSLNLNFKHPSYLHTDIPVPLCLRQIATEQIDHLSESQIFLLKIASVIWMGTVDNSTYFESNMFLPFATKEPFNSMSSIEDDLRQLEQGEYITS